MLYESYQKKILRVADILRRVVKLLPVIIAALAVVIATTATLLATKGIVGKPECPESITYGESFPCTAKAFLSSVSYEYAEAGSDEWSAEMPRMPGEYKVRGVGKASFGKYKYSDEMPFRILPKQIEVAVAQS